MLVVVINMDVGSIFCNGGLVKFSKKIHRGIKVGELWIFSLATEKSIFLKKHFQHLARDLPPLFTTSMVTKKTPMIGEEDIAWLIVFVWQIFKTLVYYRFFVTLMLSSGLPDPFFKNKNIPFPSTAVYHKNYTENISLTDNLSTYTVTLP